MPISARRLGQLLSNEALHLVVMPTEACNFRCFYCYEDFLVGRMPPKVVRGLERLLETRAPSLDHLTISWFGGEPLLERDLVLGLLEHVARLRARHPRLALESDITTNAWHLDRPLFERMLALGVATWQISFDGPKEIHDRRRKRADGRGTFDRIWSNVRALREVEGEFEIRLRVHVDRENREHLPRFLDQCREAFGEDPRFRMFLRPLSRLGGPNDARIAILAEEESDALACARAQAEERGLGLLAFEKEGEICHAAWGNSFVVRADGRLSKCTVALAHPQNDIGRLLEDGTLEIDAPKTRPWMRGLVSGRELELLCPMIGLAESAPARVGAKLESTALQG
jgi:uncharacterized protein